MDVWMVIVMYEEFITQPLNTHSTPCTFLIILFCLLFICTYSLYEQFSVKIFSSFFLFLFFPLLTIITYLLPLCCHYIFTPFFCLHISIFISTFLYQTKINFIMIFYVCTYNAAKCIQYKYQLLNQVRAFKDYIFFIHIFMFKHTQL